MANINPQKGHGTFIRAAAELKKLRPETCFAILGQTYRAHAEYHKALLQTAKDLGLVLGQDLIISDPCLEVAELAMAFDLFWMTSEPRSEGIPTVVEEAMALGLPVVATDVGSIAEIVDHGKTGLVVPPRDHRALAKVTDELIGNSRTRADMSRHARERAETDFNVDICVSKHVAAIEMARGLDQN